MNLAIQQALQNGIEAHKAGRLQEAERFYRAILQSQPLHPDANHNLGLLAVSVNKADIAVPLFKIALEANPKTEQYWLSYIDALIRNRQFKHAKQVIDQGRANHVAEEKLGILEAHLASTTEVRKPELAEQEKHSKKKQQKIKVSGPTRQQLDTLLKHYQSGFFAEAEELAISITQAFPNHQFGWKVLGAVLKSTGRVADSLAAMKKSVDLAPRDADALYNLGNTFKEIGRLDEAESSYKKVIALKPNYAAAHSNLGIMLYEQERLDEAEARFNHALTINPDFDDALYNRSRLLFDKAQYAASLRDADRCGFEKSKVRSLASLYALGRASEIYNRLERQSKCETDNLEIAAFEAFISEVEKKPAAYNFCPNPMNFIHTTNLSSYVMDLSAYIQSIVKELNSISKVWEPPEKTTVNGFQSIHSKNLFNNPTGKISELKSIIIDELGKYYSKFENEKCRFISNFPTRSNLFAWTVTLKQHGYQKLHIHPSGWLSGVIYLKVVPSLENDEGAIEFGLNSDYYFDANTPRVKFQPRLGDIVFFPSLLHHRTIPFTTDEDRIIVSFDLVPNIGKP